MNTRVIKFRKWYMGEMDYSPEVWADGEGGISVNYYIGHTEDGIWMQYIGFCDDDANEVYEGDVVEYDGKKYIVFWDSYQFNLKGFREYWRDSPYDAFSESLSFKVVGNIYEHPNMTVEEEL